MSVDKLFDISPRVDSSKAASACKSHRRLPSWLRRSLPSLDAMRQTESLISDQHLHTVCEEAKCPNRLECWSNKTATVLIMGKECTRACGFCDIDFSKTPAPCDPSEPMRVSALTKSLGLDHVVITMVTRDDLLDGGAEHLHRVIVEVRRQNPTTTIEVLTSDFQHNTAAIDIVLDAKPEIFAHNVETTRQLTKTVRHRATYDGSLWVLDYVKTHSSNNLVKSGIMVGLGETDDQVQETLTDLHRVGCSVVTVGQYLQASAKKLSVRSFVTPEQFSTYEEYGYSLGFQHMACGPNVRSSYNAHLALKG